MRRKFSFAAILVIALAADARSADDASPAARADELVHRALDRRRQGDNVGAVELLRQAEQLAPSARTLAQLGFAEFALQHWVEAETYFARTLTSPDSSWLASPKNREMLDKTLAETRRHVGRLAISGTPGAQIAVDGKPAGLLPLSMLVRVAAGVVRVTATAPGRKSFEQTTTVGGGQDVAIRIDLQQIPAPRPQVSVPPILSLERVDKRGVPGWRRWTGAGLFVAGLAGLGTGVTWVALDGRTNCTAPPGGFCDSVYDTKIRGWIAIAAGAAVAGTGAALFFWRRIDGTTVAVGPGGVSIAGGF